MGKIILAASGKGGTGKTSLCAALAVPLCLKGEKVLLADADWAMRSLETVMGMEGDLLFSYADAARGICTLEEAAVPHPLAPGIKLLTAPADDPSDLNEASVVSFFDLCREQFDYTIVDCPAGLEKLITLMAAHADMAIIVVTPDSTSVKAACTVHQLFSGAGQDNCFMVVNRVRPSLIRSGKAVNIDHAMDGSGLRLLGVVPEDSDVIACGNRGELLMPNSVGPAQAAIWNIASRIRGERVELFKNVKPGGR